MSNPKQLLKKYAGFQIHSNYGISLFPETSLPLSKRRLDYFHISQHFEDMDIDPSAKNSSLPDEYCSIAKALFPPEKGPDIVAATGFAEALGIGAEYQKLCGVKKSASQMHEFLTHFENNLELLIQKTWVEKADVNRKEKLQDEIPLFIALIEQKKYADAIKKFGAILEELVYLFFGAQSTEDDFTEYTFRIDSQIGLFWWYSLQLGRFMKSGTQSCASDEELWAVLLIGICYLTNF